MFFKRNFRWGGEAIEERNICLKEVLLGCQLHTNRIYNILSVKKKKTRHAAVVFSWYHGKISREEAEALLNDFREEGDFLVRDSVHFQGDYTLSIYFEGMVDHYRIIAKHNKLEVDGGDCLFDNLIQLVEVPQLSLVLLR